MHRLSRGRAKSIVILCMLIASYRPFDATQGKLRSVSRSGGAWQKLGFRPAPIDGVFLGLSEFRLCASLHDQL